MDIWELVRVKYPTPSSLPLPKEVVDFSNFHQSFFRLTIAYSLLYVVIEGYKELNIIDDEIEQLLKNHEDYVNKLRLLRNAIFHYQKNPFPKKLAKFIELQDSADWILKLKLSFEKFFRKRLPIDKILTRYAR